MTLKKDLLKKPGVYLIADKNILIKGNDIYVILKRCMAAGLDMLQLRDTRSCDRELIESGKKIKDLIKKKGVIFIINNRVDIALCLEADGVHLGQDDMGVETARKIIGKKRIVGVSVHSISQAIEAEHKGADYVSIGAIFPTPIKPHYKPLGVEIICKFRRAIRIPFVAIGGINEANITDVVSSGAKRAAVARAILCSENPYLATKNLIERINLTPFRRTSN